MTPYLCSFTLTLSLFMAQSLSAQQQQASLLVLSKHDHTLAIVNPISLKVQARVPVGEDPHEVIASADGSKAYVSNYGFGAFHTLAVVDLLGAKALPAVDLGALTGPHGLTSVGGKVWFTAEGAKAIGRYDPMAGKVDLVLGTGQNRTHMIYVSPDTNHVVTTNVSSGTVSLMAEEPVRMPPPPPGASAPGGGAPADGPGPKGPHTPRMDWNETVVRVGNGSEGFDMSPDGHEIWVANAQDGTISIVNVASKQVKATLQANVPGANRLKFTPDGRHVLVAMLASPGLAVFDAQTRKQIKRIPVGRGAAGIVIEPDGLRAYVACTPDNYVAVLDLNTLAVVGKIEAGDEPDGLAWAVRP